MPRRDILPAVLLTALLFLCCGLRAVVARGKPAALGVVPRFSEVSRGFYRGGQPGPGGFEFLKGIGVRTVINLREEKGEEERARVEQAGMKYVHIPIDARRPVPEEAIQDFFRVLSDQANYPVFVHCKRGADRTGVMVGFYRIAFEGWDAKHAYDEARSMGMERWRRNLRDQLYGFGAQRSRGGSLLPRRGVGHN